jgi:SulP family sulfate permease
MDATGLHALEEFLHKCKRQGTTLVLSGVQTQPRAVMARQGFDAAVGHENIVGDIDAALTRASELAAS